jgi:hypothetical protein
MFRVLKQSTAITVAMGPFLGSSDGVTPNTGLSSVTGRYYIGDGSAAAFTGSSWSHDSSGMYLVGLSTTHTGTLGILRIYLIGSSCVPIWEDFMVVDAMVYDSLCAAAGTDYLYADVRQLLGTAWLTPGTAGTPDVNVKLVNAVSTSSVTSVNANQGTTQPVNFTGTGVNALVKGDTVDIDGSAVSTSSAQIGVNAVNIGGTAQTGRDIGASVLLSSGTGTGQLDITSGVVKSNLVQILGTALTETAGYIAASFKKFFNVSTPTGTVNSIPDAVAGATGGIAIVGSVMGKSPATLESTDVTGNLPADVKAITAGVDFTATMKTSLNDATPSVTVSDKTGFALTAGEHTNIVSDVESGLTSQGYTTTRAGYIDVLNGIIAAIWGATTRTLTTVADSSGVTTLLSRIASALTITSGKVDVNDKTEFSLNTSQRVKLDSSQPDYAPSKAGDQMSLISAYGDSLGVKLAALQPYNATLDDLNTWSGLFTFDGNGNVYALVQGALTGIASFTVDDVAPTKSSFVVTDTIYESGYFDEALLYFDSGLNAKLYSTITSWEQLDSNHITVTVDPAFPNNVQNGDIGYIRNIPAGGTSGAPTVGEIVTGVEGSDIIAKQATLDVIDTNITAIRTKTDALPDDPAAVSDIPSVNDIVIGVEGSTVIATQSTLNVVDTNVSAIRSQTDKLQFDSDNKVIAVSNQGGIGDTEVNHDTGGTDNYRVLDGNGQGIDNVSIKAYLKTEWDAGHRSETYVVGRSQTNVDGRWQWPLMLDTGFTYVLVFYKQGQFKVTTKELTL